MPRDRKTGLVKTNPPWRKAFIKVDNFGYTAEDGVLNLRFALRSGSYATGFLRLLANTDDPEEMASENDIYADSAGLDPRR